MRRRGKGLLTTEETIFEKPIAKRFTRLDLYPKLNTDVKKTTQTGGVISLFAICVLLFLLITELYHYVAGTYAYKDELSVDRAVGEKVDVNINITFPHMKCSDLHLDIMDASGVQQNALHATMRKNPVLADGEIIHTEIATYQPPPVTESGRYEREYDPELDITSEEYCGSCGYKHLLKDGSVNITELEVENKEAEANNQQNPLVITSARGNALVFQLLSGLGIKMKKPHCCNSCVEALKAYQKIGMKKEFNQIPQCAHELFIQNPGCNLEGSLKLAKVKGNFHFAPGLAVQVDSLLGGGDANKHMHTFDTATAHRFNISHHIHELSFGKPLDKYKAVRNRQLNPLTGQLYTVPRQVLCMHRYQIKIVGAMHRYGTSEPHKSFEYSSTQNSKCGSIQQRGFTPGLFFIYDFYPIHITHVFERPPLTQFLVKVASILGGVFVCCGMLDQVSEWVGGFRKKFTSTAPSTV